MGPETDDRNITRRAHHAPRSNSLRAPSAVARRLRRPIAATPIQPEGQSPDWLRTRYPYDRLCTFVSHIFRYPLAYSGYVLPNPPFKISLPIYFPNSSLNSFSSCRTIPPLHHTTRFTSRPLHTPSSIVVTNRNRPRVASRYRTSNRRPGTRYLSPPMQRRCPTQVCGAVEL